jgi:hypothetical protein
MTRARKTPKYRHLVKRLQAELATGGKGGAQCTTPARKRAGSKGKKVGDRLTPYTITRPRLASDQVAYFQAGFRLVKSTCWRDCYRLASQDRRKYGARLKQMTGTPRAQGDAEAQLKTAEAAADAEVAASAAGGGFAKPDVRELLGAQLALLPYTACKARRRAAGTGEGAWLARSA